MVRPHTDTKQISFRVPSDWEQRAEVLADRLSRLGATASTSSVYRAALDIGLATLERQRGIAPSRPARKTR
jgi:predicted DNA-binding protein